ncbi:MAG: hypothetical protein ACJ788_01615 [Ktedonobacteraceae bacterium]
MANPTPDQDVEATDVPISWEVEISLEQRANFTELLHQLATHINPGNSLKEVCIIADNVLALKIQSLTGKPYRSGPHYPEGVTVVVEKGNTFSNIILIRQAFFTSDETGILEQISILLEELYHCWLYHQTWQRRGSINLRSADLYTNELFRICGQIHDEYAVARLKNIFLGGHLTLRDEQGQSIPLFIEYGSSLSALFDQIPHQLRTRDILQIAPLIRKSAMLPIVYRFIFEPLARHAGFLTPIPPDYPLQWSDNSPEENVFYREMIAPYWVQIKSSLEVSFDSQFNETEKALDAICKTVDACLDRLRQEYKI